MRRLPALEPVRTARVRADAHRGLLLQSTTGRTAWYRRAPKPTARRPVVRARLAHVCRPSSAEAFTNGHALIRWPIRHGVVVVARRRAPGVQRNWERSIPLHGNL